MRLDFAAIVEANQSMVFSVALRFVRDRAAAEELAQDVFLQLYQQFAHIESAAHATWWLRRAVCHRSIDEVRKRGLRPRIGLDHIPEPADPFVPPDPLLREQIRGIVDTLPPKARAVLLLRYQQDLEPLEIAELLAMPISTVKSHLHRSLTLLRGRLRRSCVQKQEVCS